MLRNVLIPELRDIKRTGECVFNRMKRLSTLPKRWWTVWKQVSWSFHLAFWGHCMSSFQDLTTFDIPYGDSIKQECTWKKLVHWTDRKKNALSSFKGRYFQSLQYWNRLFWWYFCWFTQYPSVITNITFYGFAIFIFKTSALLLSFGMKLNFGCFHIIETRSYHEKSIKNDLHNLFQPSSSWSLSLLEGIHSQFFFSLNYFHF